MHKRYEPSRFFTNKTGEEYGLVLGHITLEESNLKANISISYFFGSGSTYTGAHSLDFLLQLRGSHGSEFSWAETPLACCKSPQINPIKLEKLDHITHLPPA